MATTPEPPVMLVAGKGTPQLIRHHLSDKAGVGVRQTSRRGVDDHAQAFAVREVGGGSAAAGVRTAAGSGGAAAGSRAGSVASAAGGQSPQDEGGAQASCRSFFQFFIVESSLFYLSRLVSFLFLYVPASSGEEAHIKNRMMGGLSGRCAPACAGPHFAGCRRTPSASRPSW